MTDVAAFVLARLAEDEQAARVAARFRYDQPTDAPWERARQLVAQGAALSSDHHIARHDPDRVLAEVAAKHALLAWLDELDEYMTERNLWDRPDTSMPRKIMAQPYADHPDYREEWSTEL